MKRSSFIKSLIGLPFVAPLLSADYVEIEGVDFRVMKALVNGGVYTEINEKAIRFIYMKTHTTLLQINKKKANKTYNVIGIKLIVIDKILKIHD